MFLYLHLFTRNLIIQFLTLHIPANYINIELKEFLLAKTIFF